MEGRRGGGGRKGMKGGREWGVLRERGRGKDRERKEGTDVGEGVRQKERERERGEGIRDQGKER